MNPTTLLVPANLGPIEGAQELVASLSQSGGTIPAPPLCLRLLALAQEFDSPHGNHRPLGREESRERFLRKELCGETTINFSPPSPEEKGGSPHSGG